VTVAALADPATRTPELHRLAVAGRTLAADLAGVVTSVQVSWATGSVAELAVDCVDPRGLLAGHDLTRRGATVTLDGRPWVVGTVRIALAGDGADVTVRCRSALAGQMRLKRKITVQAGVSPSQWVAARVAAHGGTSTCQPSATRKAVSQAGGTDPQSELDVVGSLAGDLDWSWTEWDGRFLFGSRWWAWQGSAGLPAWAVTWLADPGADAATAAAEVSDDDTDTAGTLDLTLPAERGRLLRPWHRVLLAPGAAWPDLAGAWLVDTVTWPVDGTSDVEVKCVRPLRPSPPVQAATGSGDADGGTGTGDGAGVAAGSRRARAVAYALAHVHDPYRVPAHPPHSWDCAKLTQWAWRAAGIGIPGTSAAQRARCTPISRSELRPGDLIFCHGHFRGEGYVHHVGMYTGGGRTVEAGNKRSGVHTGSLAGGWWGSHLNGCGRVPGADDDG